MIISFGDRATEDIFNGLNSKTARKIPRAIWHVACRKLDMINAAHELKDLRIPPANRLEKLKGSLSAYCSIRVNEKYRVIFIWKGNNVENVSITDYH